MDSVVYITGHQNPDTDSICSVIAYAELKKKIGVNAVPRCLGELSRETSFVLNHFGVEPPELLDTVKTQVSDLNMDSALPVSPEISIKTAWSLMRKNNISTIAVVDENERLLGIVTLSNITNKYMDAMDNNTIASTKTSLRNIVETLNARLVCGTQEEFETTGKVVVAASHPNDMKPFIEKGDIVIAGNRSDSQSKAIESGANCLVVTCGGEIDPEIIEMARGAKCVVMTTPVDTFTTARLINQSIPVGSIMTRDNLVKFNVDDFVNDVRERMVKSRYRSYPVVDDNGRIKGFISRYHLISQRRKKVILLDHNEKSQTVNGIDEAEILEIIDHHRLGDIQTASPIFFKNEPVGSTATIIANMYFDAGIKPTRSIAGVLCAAILSDTIRFQSPTSTYVDRITADKLAEMSGINIEEFAQAMFKAGSSLQGKTPEEIFHQDFKEYVLAMNKIGIGQVYTMGTEDLTDVRDSLIEFMENLRNNRGYNLLMLFLTDVLKQGSEVLFVGDDKDLVAKAFGVSIGKNSAELPGIVSRKKQILPSISFALERM